MTEQKSSLVLKRDIHSSKSKLLRMELKINQYMRWVTVINGQQVVEDIGMGGQP